MASEVSLLIDGQVFDVPKDLLCEWSDYFSAMFSGNFSENDKREITIDVVDAASMTIIIRYMKMGFIDLSDYPLYMIGELAISANFLQITELIKQIEYWLDLQLSSTSWLQIMSIAENASYKKLEQLSAAYGLYEFKRVTPQVIPSIHKLVWYLSHTHLNAESELQVFKFGLDWVLQRKTSADALLCVLACLDICNVDKEEWKEIKILIEAYSNSLVGNVIDCFYKLAMEFEVSSAEIRKVRTLLVGTYSEIVYLEVVNLVKYSTKRKLQLKPSVALWPVAGNDLSKVGEVQPNYLYTFTNEKGFVKWLEVTEKNLWGWTAVNWGPTKVIIVCGENGRGTGLFWRSVKVYDTLRKEWTNHGVQLPQRRHAGVGVVGDLLYLIAGIGGYRVVLDTAVVYDLRQRSYRSIANFPDAVQGPAVCVHNNTLYAAGHRHIYRYEDNGDSDTWITIMQTDLRLSCMASFNGYLFCTQNFFNNIYKFRPETNGPLESIMCFNNLPLTLCNLGTRLMGFTCVVASESEKVTVEEYVRPKEHGKAKIVWANLLHHVNPFSINDVAGTCAITDEIPPINAEISPYITKYLASQEQSCSS